jgi:hypothetical protein
MKGYRDEGGRSGMARGQEPTGHRVQKTTPQMVWTLHYPGADWTSGISTGTSCMKVHNMFHVDLLMPYKETEAYGMPYTQPLPMIKEGEEEYEIKLIIRARR